jgi:hypothetical protein
MDYKNNQAANEISTKGTVDWGVSAPSNSNPHQIELPDGRHGT